MIAIQYSSDVANLIQFNLEIAFSSTHFNILTTKRVTIHNSHVILMTVIKWLQRSDML